MSSWRSYGRLNKSVMILLQQVALLGLLYAVFAVAELLRPVEKSQPMRGRIQNILLTLVFLTLGGTLAFAISTRIPLPEALQTQNLPVKLLAIVCAVFAWDVLFYWYHRAEHAWPWLWRIHRLHHSDTSLNATSALRHFWLESPLQALAISLPVNYVLSLGYAEAMAFNIIATTWLVFVHANWRLHLGIFTFWLGNPQVHRIHHSVREEHRDKNFAVYFPLIDKIFGTYYAPRRDEFPQTGIPGGGFRHPLWREGLVEPLVFWDT